MNIREKLAALLGLKAAPEGKGFEGFTDEQLKAAESAALENFAKARTDRDLEIARESTALVEAVRDEAKIRIEAATNLENELADLAGKITVTDDPATPAEDEPKPDDAPATGDPATPAEQPAGEPATPAETATPAPVAATPATPPPAPAVPVAAAVAPVVPAPSASPVIADAAPAITIIASGDVKGFSAGQEMKPEDMGEAFATKFEATRGSKSTGRFPVAEISWEYPAERYLDHKGDPQENTDRVLAVVAAAQEQTRKNLAAILDSTVQSELLSLTAAGGLCAPVNVRYDIFTLGSDVRPLRDSLTRFGASRGGIRFNAPPTLVDVAGSANFYTEAQDAAGTDYPKGCIRIDCGDDVEVKINAIPLCMTVGNFQRNYFPENFSAWWGLGHVAHSRLAEEQIWARLVQLGTDVTAGEGLGAARDVLAQVARTAGQYRDRHRIAPETPLRLHAPSWLVELMQVDLLRQAPGDNTLGIARGRIAQFLAAFNIAVTFVLDGQPAGGASGYPQVSGPINPWPNKVELMLSVDGVFLFLDGGSMDFGTEIRDFDMIRQNDVGAFMETFEAVAMVGPDAIHLTLDICPDGTTAGTDDSFDPCVLGS